MITRQYNPSPLEVDFSKLLVSLKDEIEAKLEGQSIESIENKIDADNPILIFHLKDTDGDEHKLVLKIIQKPDFSVH